MTAKPKSKKHHSKSRRRQLLNKEPIVSIPLSELAKIPSLKKLIGRKKKLSKKDSGKILKLLLKHPKHNGKKLPVIKSFDDLLNWYEKEGMQHYAQELLNGNYDFCRTANPLLEFYRGKYTRQIYTGKYANFDVTKLPLEWKKRISGATSDKQIIKILDEFESSKNQK